jgi:site-specific DNA-methyltransferase (adenine-specific)
MWVELNRVVKPGRAIVLTASQPFTSTLIQSNLKQFKHEWIWRKNTGSGVAIAKYQPMRYHENILVFGEGRLVYHPQPHRRFSESSERRCRTPVRGGGMGTSHHYQMKTIWGQHDPLWKGPESVLDFRSVPNGGGSKVHPTQKPVELMEYLIKTYSDEGDIVLDFAMGSGTTGVACVNLGRKFIGCDNDTENEYFQIAEKRIGEAMKCRLG